MTERARFAGLSSSAASSGAGSLPPPSSVRAWARALGGVAGLGPLPFDPFEIGEPRAVYPLVHHPRRHERPLPCRRRRGKGERELVVILRRHDFSMPSNSQENVKMLTSLR